MGVSSKSYFSLSILSSQQVICVFTRLGYAKLIILPEYLHAKATPYPLLKLTYKVAGYLYL